MLGIFWGTLSVILLMSLGDSFYLYQKNAMDTIADGKTLVFFGQTQLSYQGKPPGQTIHMRTADLDLLKKSIPGLSQSTPIIGDCKRNECPNITSMHNRKRSPIMGVDASYADMLHLKMITGSHFFSADDVKRQSHDIILGDELNEYLFPYGGSIGQTVTLSGVPFTVIGVLMPDRTGQPGSAWNTSSGFIPYSTYNSLWGDTDINEAIFMPNNKANQPELINNLRHYLARRFHFSPEDNSAVFIPDIASTLDFVKTFFWLFKLFLTFSGAMTLVVGGIGVANIMFLIVSERTKEIGLYMALGARDRYILNEVLWEAGSIILLGGFLGIVVAAGFILTLNLAPLPPWLGQPTLSLENFLITNVILLVIALLAGYFPAKRAIQLSPVAALNDEA